MSINEIESFKNKIKKNIFNLINKNQIQQAKKLILEYEKIASIDLEIYHAWSIIFIIEGKYKLAEKYLKTAVHLDNFNADTYYNLGYLYEITGDLTKAFHFYEQSKQYCEDQKIISEVNKIQHHLLKLDPKLVKYKCENTNEFKKVLMIAHIFPPLGGSGVQRTLKFVKYIRNFGWEPVVVTAGKSHYPFKDESLLEEIPDGVRIIRIDEDFTINTQVLSEIHSIIEKFKVDKRLFETYKQYTFKNAEAINIPDLYITWANKVLKEIGKYIDMSEIDLIYSTSGPYSDHVIGFHLKYKYNKPWIADFRDEWTNNPYANPDKNNWVYKMHFALEKRIVHFADKVIQVTPLSTDNCKNIFNLKDEKVVTITNGYDEDDFKDLSVSDKKNKKFTIIHNGLLYGIRNIMPVLKAIRNLINKGKIEESQVKLKLSWTENAREFAEHIKSLKLENIVEYTGYVSHKESLQIASESDVLLLIVGPGEKTKSMYPGKLFEYLRLQKPILSLSPEESVVDHLIKKLNRGINVEFDDIESIEKALLTMYQDWREKKKKLYEINEEVEKFERKNLTRKLTNIFNEVYSDYLGSPNNDINFIDDFIEQEIIEEIYFSQFGEHINFQKPKSFNEKIQWIKLNYRNPLMIKCADKYDVREYIKEKNLDSILNDIYGIYHDVEDIDLSKLPNSFVLKATHGSGWNIICRDKSELDWKVKYEKIKSWLNTNYYDIGGEWVYKNIQPRIIAERLLVDEKGNLPKDYKIFCFNGKPKIIQVDLDRYQNHKRNLYDLEWNKLPVELQLPNSSTPVEKPKQLELMLEISKILSEDFPFVRVDLYNVNGKIYFGELTFYPGNGFEKFKPKEFDLLLGSYLDLSCL